MLIRPDPAKWFWSDRIRQNDADLTLSGKIMLIWQDPTKWCWSDRIRQNDADLTGSEKMMLIWQDPTKWCWSDRIRQNDADLTGSGKMMLIRQDPEKWCCSAGSRKMMLIWTINTDLTGLRDLTLIWPDPTRSKWWISANKSRANRSSELDIGYMYSKTIYLANMYPCSNPSSALLL